MNKKEHKLTHDPIKNELRSLLFDIKAEVLLANLAKTGMSDMEAVVVRPKGTFHRAYHQDILKIEIKKKGNKEGCYFLDIAREGLYDMLPEGLFHQTLKKDAQVDTATAVKEIKMHQQEEKAARTFFLPLEQEFYYQRIQLEILEKKLWGALSREKDHELLTGFWELEKKYFNQRQMALLLALLPFMHQIVGDLTLTASALEIMLGEKVHLKPLSPDSKVLNNPVASELGSAMVGMDLIVGNTWYADTPVLALEIGPVAASALLWLMPEGEAHSLLEILFGLFIPAEAEVIPQIILQEGEDPFVLSDEPFTGRLNYTTTI